MTCVKVRHSKAFLVVTLVVVAVVGLFGTAYAFHLFWFGTPNCWSRPSNVPSTAAYFVVVAANEGRNVGYNGSEFHNGPWPIMNVTMGETVWIHVISNDTVQAHGFAIATYFNRGLTLGPGQCADVTFIANQLGSFRVYCFIICTIHVFMLNGEVNVNP